MKRKVIMMGLAMIAGVPHAACANSGKGSPGQAYSSWSAPYMPHYGSEGVAHPMMDHIAVGAAHPRQDAHNVWRLDFSPPAAVLRADDPLSAKDKRVGVSLKLDF
jgi:hypothetical protein